MTATDDLTRAKQLLATDPAMARRLAEQVQRRAPSNESALLIAAAARRSGDATSAVTLLAVLEPRLKQAWGVQYEYGMALASIGNVAGGMKALRRAVALHPAAVLANHALRDLCHLTGDAVAAGAHARLLSNGALVATAAAFLDGDETALGTLLARFGIDVCDIAGACLIADLGAASGRHEAVAGLLDTASSTAPDYPPALLRCAEALHHAGRDGAALSVIERLADLAPDAVPVLLLHGAILMALSREPEAIDLLARATVLAPQDARVRQSHGHALRSIGRRDDALVAYRRAIDLAPGFGEGYWSIADLKTSAFRVSEIAAMERLVSDGELDPRARSLVHFALGRAREDGGDAADAFAHYLHGNALRRSLVPHDADAHDAFIGRTIDTFDAKFFADRAGVGATAADPIFVLGMPRSGSSLIEQILASHPEVEGASELPDVTAIARGIPATMPYPDGLAGLPNSGFAALGSDYLARTRLRRRTDRPYFVDKFPGNFLHIGLIHLMLPNARIIDVRRDARDCCVSLFAQSFAAGQGYSYDLGDLGRYHAAYAALMGHVDTVLPGRVLRVDYEAVVDDIEGETRRLLDHCGLAFDPACLRFFETSRSVRTASSEQVRQPIYRGSIGRWKRFEPWLGPLLDVLERRDDDGFRSAR